ncbi:MAG: signal peptidase II [Acetivibrionales bacterium]|jgi:signal peptidase II
MKIYKNNYIYFIVFVLFWPIYKTYHLLFKNIPEYSIIPLLIPFFTYLIFGLFFLFLNREHQINSPILIILCMVCADLLIKTLVFFTKPDIPIWDVCFRIKYVPNYYHTAIFSLLKIESPFFLMMLFKAILVALGIYFFTRFYKRISIFIDVALICLLAAMICGLFDILIFKHTVDYFFMNGYLVYDLKDVYVDIFLCLFIAYQIDLSIQNRKSKLSS